jgi:hypothetical protein
MKPLIWSSPENYPRRHFALVEQQCRAATWEIKKAATIDFSSNVMRFAVPAPLQQIDKWDVLLTDVLIPLVRREAVNVLKSLASASIQLIPASVQATDATTDEFLLLNVTATSAAVNYEQSEYSEGTGGFLIYRHLVLLDDCLNGLHIVREERTKPLILVSQELKDAMARKKVKGVRFCKPSECGYARPE